MYNSKQPSRTLFSTLLFIMTVLFILSIGSDVFAGYGGKHKGKGHNKHMFSCTLTSKAALQACKNEVADDLWIAIGNCANLSDAKERPECMTEARETQLEELETCEMQYDARQEVCSGLGEAPYDPDLNDRKFANPDKIGGDVEPNPYWPLVVGTEWVYNAYDEEGELVEIITVYVTNDIKEIEYPEGSGQIFRCRVVTDLVTTPDGTLIEDTNDWYAQDEKGNVWYFGEIAVNYEDGEVTDVEGSWTSGVDGAKPGILMWANPGKKKGKMYRQEFFLGDAEDMALVLSKDEVEVKVPFYTYTKNVLQTEEWTPIEPEVTEFKYYAPGIGMVLEEGPDGETVELIKKAIVQVP